MTVEALNIYNKAVYENAIIYPSHNQNYLNECLDNLKNKGIFLNI